jgi:hypothetical protein
MADPELKTPESKNPDQALDRWMKELYDMSKLTQNDIDGWYEEYRYQGFDRLTVFKELMRLVPNISESQQIIMVCALKGPVRASLTRLKSGKTIESYRIPASGAKGTKGISCARITAATADLAAFLLKKSKSPKRLNLDCPGYLQFPSAGSISLPPTLRAQHKEFSIQFSKVIGGVFNEQIYETMVRNAYLDQRLSLFPQ